MGAKTCFQAHCNKKRCPNALPLRPEVTLVLPLPLPLTLPPPLPLPLPLPLTPQAP